MTNVVSLELNEMNFEFVEKFVGEGRLPTFARVLRDSGLIKTDAGEAYPYLEPWIQWPSIYTGKPYSGHQLFRLGDAAQAGNDQIWEKLERKGLRVAAVSPMNAANRCANPAFFLPDPWTSTTVSADQDVINLYEYVKRQINDNASDNKSVLSKAVELLPLALKFMSPSSIGEYYRVSKKVWTHKWARAAAVDRLLADLFLNQWRKNRPHYASLFLNAAAHIQHHHMYDSSVYCGTRNNPEWYSSAAKSSIDPLLFVYQTYDDVLADMMALPNTRLMISTGLSQYPNESEHYQYRLTDPNRILSRLGLTNFEVQPLMSRDFLLIFSNSSSARASEEKLMGLYVCGEPLFKIDNRGESLFCQVAFHGTPEALGRDETSSSLEIASELTLVSIENGLHKAVGYHIDTGLTRAEALRVEKMSLPELHDKYIEVALTPDSALQNVA